MPLNSAPGKMWEGAIGSDQSRRALLELKILSNYLELFAGMVWWKELVFAETVAKGFSCPMKKCIDLAGVRRSELLVVKNKQKKTHSPPCVIIQMSCTGKFNELMKKKN